MPNTLTKDQIISATYVALFTRAPDQKGLNEWRLEAADKTGMALAIDMAVKFAAHPAFTTLYGGMGDAAFIDAIYVNIGGKVADAQGRTAWLNKLTDTANPITRAELVGEFIHGVLSITPAEINALDITAQEKTDAIARQDQLNNKATVALEFTAAMGVGSNLAAGTDGLSLESLAKDPAYVASQAIISGVTADDATMTAPSAYLQGTPTLNGIITTFGNGQSAGGKTFMLTTGTDNLTGTSGNDTINAGALAPDGVTAATTLNALDVINGGAGTDTLVLDTTGNQNQSVAGTITNVENLTFVGSGAAIAAVDATSFSGAIRFQQTADATVSVTGATGQNLVLDRVADTTALTAGYAAAQTTATLQAAAVVGDATFSISGTGLKTANLTVDKTATGKSVTVTDTGNTTEAASITASGASTVTVTSTALKSVTVAGAGAVSLTTTTAPTTSVDASASTGGLTLVTALAAGASFTGGVGKDSVTAGASTKAIAMGAGDDVVTLSVAALGSGGSADGGEGSDTIALTAANAATATSNATLGAAFAASISNFEKFGIGATGATDTVLDAQYIDGITHIISAGTATGTLTVNNLAANSTFESTALQGDFVSLNLKDITGTSDVVNLKFSATDGFTSTAAMTVAGVETLNITTDDTDTTAPTTVFTAPITATSVKSVVVAGDVGINLTGLTATTLTSFDASGVTATGAAGAVTITTGILAGDAVLTGGAGNDVINAAASVKLVTLNGGAGNDTLTGSSTKANTINGGAGDDTIVGGAAVDTIDAGAGNDTITSGAGLDVINVGAGNDTYVVTANANGNIYASITGMGAGDKIDFLAGAGVNTFTTAAITLAPTAAFADFLQAAAAGGADRVVWFQYSGDTYLVQDVTAGATFTNGADQVVKLVGLVDLSTATIDGATTNVLTLA